MLLKYFLLLVFYFQLSCGENSLEYLDFEQEDVDDLRIVNGVSAPAGKYTSLVSLQEGNFHICGASILSRDFALTAAHCITNTPTAQLQIVSSVTHLLDNKGIRYRVTKAISHEDYNSSNLLINDIALLKVSPPFNLAGGGESAVALPRKNENVATGTKATVVGWGRTLHNGPTSKTLNEVNLTVTNYWDCSKTLGDIYPTQFCASNLRKGICEGDSGGPIYVDNKLVGLASWRDGSKTCGAGFGVYTQVSNYLDWIFAKMRQLSLN